MADNTLAGALEATRINLLAIAQLAIDDVANAYSYAAALPNTANIFQLLLTGYDEQLVTGSTQRYTFYGELRLRVDVWLAGYDGQLQTKAAWEYLPAAAQYFVEHRGINNPTTGARPPFLDPMNTHVARGRVVAEDGKLWVIFSWDFVYNTLFARCGL